MKTTVEELDDNRVKLSIEVDAADFEVEVDKAFKKIARDVRLPGFRKGKVPRKVLEARFGSGVARGQALEDSLPEYFLSALGDYEIDIVGPPEYQLVSGEEDGDVAFDAVVPVRPEVEIDGYQGIVVEVPRLEPDADDIDARIDSFRDQFAELVEVERPAVDGDTVVVDIATQHDGEPLEALTADDYTYPVGTGGLVPELDDNLMGAKVGDILEFEAEHPVPDEDGTLEFRILVKQVQERVLPELTDDLVSGASDFETVADFRDDVVENLRKSRLDQAHEMWHQDSVSQLAELVTDEPPEAMIDNEVRGQLEQMIGRFAQSGMPFEQYLEMTGQSIEDVVAQLQVSAVGSVKVDMALRAVAIAEGLEADDDDIEAEFDSIAEANGLDPDELREQISTTNQRMLFRADITKRKAADWLLESVEVIDEDGNPVDKAALHPESDDHDHDHDHDNNAEAHDHAEEEE